MTLFLVTSSAVVCGLQPTVVPAKGRRESLWALLKR